MLFRNAITKLRLPALLAFIVMNLASMDLMAGGYVMTGSAHGCWIFHRAPVAFPHWPEHPFVKYIGSDVKVDCTPSNKGLDVSSVSIESHLQRSRASSSGYANHRWKKNKLDMTANSKNYQSIGVYCSIDSKGYHYAVTSRVSAKLKSGKRLGYSKWFNKKPNSRTRKFMHCA